MKRFLLLWAISLSCLAQEQVWVANVPSVSVRDVGGIPSGMDFNTAVGIGLVDGYSSVNKFGHNIAASSGDTVWGGDGEYAFFPTNAQAVSVVSSSADDTDGGNGAWTAQFYGLDANWLEANEIVTLNGTTPVQLTNTYIRMFRGVILETGITNNVGNISVTNGAGDVAIYINALDGQTQHAVYTIPGDKTGYFLKGYVGLATTQKSAQTAEFQWQTRPNNGYEGAWATKGEIGLMTLGSSHFDYEYGIPSGPLAPKTDIRMITTDVSVEMGVVAGFDILLKDN